MKADIAAAITKENQMKNILSHIKTAAERGQSQWVGTRFEVSQKSKEALEVMGYKVYVGSMTVTICW